MTPLFLQAVPPSAPSSGPAMPVVWLLFTIIPVALILTGTVLGFRALQDIRLASGTLGGAMRATFAAGLLPALFILFACGAGLTLLGEELTPAGRPRSEMWLTVGCGIGLWLSFVMMRAMHREATRWTAPDTGYPGHSRLATAAIVLTIVGAAVILILVVLPSGRLPLAMNSRKVVVLLDLPVIIAGLICGVLSYRETAGKTCTWICGALFAALLLLFSL